MTRTLSRIANIGEGVAAQAAISVPALRVALYLRVSTAEQAEGHSMDSQLDGCSTFATAKGGVVVEVYEDAGFSATSTNRPAFLRMLAAAEEGRFDAVVVLKFDRFARSLEDWVVQKRALERKGVRVLSVTEVIEDNPMAPVMEALYGGMAEYYSKDLSVKVGRGLRKRAEKGLMNGMPPFGYAQSADATHEPPVIVPEEAEAVLTAFTKYVTGSTMVSIADDLNAAEFRTRYRARRGTDETAGRGWSSQSVSALLANPVYAGFITHRRDVIGRGQHEAIVSEDLFRQAERIRASARGRPAAPRRDIYLLRGLVRCTGCGSPLQGNHGGRGKRIRYYRETAMRRGIECPAPQVSINAERLEHEVDGIVRRFTMPDDVRQRVLDLLSNDRESGESVESRRAAVEERLRRLTRAYLDVQLDEPTYDSQRRGLEAELERLTVPTERAVMAAETFDVLQRAWTVASPPERRTIALALFEAIYIDTAARGIADVVVAAPFRPWLSDWRAA